MLRFSKTIKIRILFANLVEIHYYKVGNRKLENFAILVCKINLVKNQEFIGQLGENQLINILPK